MVDAAPECHMTTCDAALEIDFVGSFELSGVSIAGAPEQEHGGASWDSNVTQRGVPGNRSHHVPERGFEAEGFLNERRDLVRILPELLLKFWTLGQHSDCIGRHFPVAAPLGVEVIPTTGLSRGLLRSGASDSLDQTIGDSRNEDCSRSRKDRFARPAPESPFAPPQERSSVGLMTSISEMAPSPFWEAQNAWNALYWGFTGDPAQCAPGRT
jgi:hypothetical protein